MWAFFAEMWYGYSVKCCVVQVADGLCVCVCVCVCMCVAVCVCVEKCTLLNNGLEVL
jgi:hypothetical protein